MARRRRSVVRNFGPDDDNHDHERHMVTTTMSGAR
jgi:hypothetical protein